MDPIVRKISETNIVLKQDICPDCGSTLRQVIKPGELYTKNGEMKITLDDEVIIFRGIT